MVLSAICPPALIYLVFSVTQISIDTFQGMYNTAFAKVWVSLIFTVVLNYLCSRGLGIISWFIVFIPFTLMTLIISILLYLFGLDPATGRLKIYAPSDKFKQDVIDYRRLSRERGHHARHMERKVKRELKEHEPEYDAHYNHRDKGRHHDFARGSDGDREDDWRTSHAGIHNDHIDELPHWQKKILKKEYGADWKQKYEQHEKHEKHAKHGHEKHHGHHGQHKAHKEPFLDNFNPTWPTLQMPEVNISAPLVSFPKIDLGSLQLPIPTAVSLGCFGKCD